jgi:hypothetical protein
MSTPIQNFNESTMRIVRVLRDDVLFLSRAQVEMLSEGNKRAANKQIARLVDARILKKRLRLDTYPNFRSPIYHLGVEGCRLLGMSKEEMTTYLAKAKSYSDRALTHLLEVYDVFIKFYLASRVTEWMWHNDEKWFSIELGLYPDGYVQFEKEGKKYSAFIEVDRGTEGISVVKDKFRKYARFNRSGAFKRLFGDRALRVLFITTTEERIEKMENAGASDDIWFTTKAEFMRESLWARHWFAKEDFYNLDVSPLPEAPAPPPSLPENLESESLEEEEKLRWRKEEAEAKALGHKINNRLAWGSLYGFVGLWGLSVASLKPQVSLIMLLIVLYVVIFSDS